MWARRCIGRTVFEHMQGYPTDEGYCHITMPARSRYVLHFKGKGHFKVRSEIDGRRVNLYLRAYLAGRRTPVWLLVWKPRR